VLFTVPLLMNVTPPGKDPLIVRPALPVAVPVFVAMTEAA
jgi:hypothetical protein